MTDTRYFPHEPQSVPAARRFATSVLPGASPETLEAVELMVSVVATNCTRHPDSGFDLSIPRSGDDIRVESSAHAGGTPTMRSPKPTDPSGRGLKIIDMLSARWGVRSDGSRGKTGGFTLAAPTPAPPRM